MANYFADEKENNHISPKTKTMLATSIERWNAIGLEIKRFTANGFERSIVVNKQEIGNGFTRVNDNERGR